MTEMAKCPFCFQNKSHLIKIDDSIQVYCDWCGARGPTAGEDTDAINYWNNRVMTEPDQEPNTPS